MTGRRTWTARAALALITASVLAVPVPSTGEEGGRGGGSCLESAALATLRAEIAAANAAARARTLTASGLEPIELLHTAIPVRSGTGPSDVEYEPWTKASGPDDIPMLAGDAATYDCRNQRGDALKPAEFVVDGQGNVYRLLEASGPAEARTAVACGCAPPWGGRGTPCGAWMPEREQLLYSLPEGTTFAGDFQLPDPENRLRLTYSKSGDECPRRDPPP